MTLNPMDPLTATFPVTVTFNLTVDLDHPMARSLMTFDGETVRALVNDTVRRTLQDAGIPAMNRKPEGSTALHWAMITLDTTGA